MIKYDAPTIIIQARMGSTRLKGKVLKAVNNRPLLSFLLERLKKSKRISQIIIATTENKEDDEIVDFANKNEVLVFRGKNDDVLDRYFQAATLYSANPIIRITADCPLMDPGIIDKVFDFYAANDFDYVSNTMEWTYPRGMDVEIFSYKCLAEAAALAMDPIEREHVTLYIYKHPEKFRLGNMAYKKDVSEYRFTVDTEDDFILIRKILSELYPEKQDFTFEDILALMEKHPHWKEINAHVKQKKV